MRGGFDLMGGAPTSSRAPTAPARRWPRTVAYFSDEAVEDADGFLVEDSLATGQFSAQASFLSLGDAISTSNVDNENPGNPFNLEADCPIGLQTPCSRRRLELGVRFQDFDDTADSALMDFGANFAPAATTSSTSSTGRPQPDNGATDTLTIGVDARF